MPRDRAIFFTDTTSGTSIDRFFEAEVEEIIRQAAPKTFTFQQNTHINALNELEEQYPLPVLDDNLFDQPMRQRLSGYIENLTSHMNELRRAILFHKVLTRSENTKLEKTANRYVDTQHGREYRRELLNGANIRNTYFYEQYACALAEYRRAKRDLLTNRRLFAEERAEYVQKRNMIRQRPHKTITIGLSQIPDILMNWPNIFGVSVEVSYGELLIRIGMCDIEMSDSATESRYANPCSILLAPFFITLRLTREGNVFCPSASNSALGLSSYGNRTRLGYDFHPHQLSDAPCFGSFGQNINQTANNGDIFSLVNLLIAFYSQYNSRDSAGVNARNYHPNNIALFEDPDRYADTLVNSIRNGTESIINTNKLHTAMERYATYHSSPPERAPYICDDDDTLFCDHCGTNEVNDDDEYVVTAYETRVCVQCWHEYYCTSCEYGSDDCHC